MKQEQVFGVIRHALTFVGGFLVMKGMLDEGMLNEGIGIIISAVGFVWSLINKIKETN
jgi:hypothetical protein